MKLETHYRNYGDSAIVSDLPQTETGHDDDGERQQGERFWVEQERLAGEEKAERAREMLELMRQKEIEQQRMTAGLCMFCGQRLRIALRLFRVKKHRACHHFTELVAADSLQASLSARRLK